MANTVNKNIEYWVEKIYEALSGSTPGGGGCDCDPVEANPTIEEGDETTPLEALKVGENVYTVGGGSGGGLAPMIVPGEMPTVGNKFIASPSAPSWADAYEHMQQGGIIYFQSFYQGEPVSLSLATTSYPDAIAFSISGDEIEWSSPTGGGGGDEPIV